MQREIYLKDLSIEEILDRLEKGKSVYYNNDSNIFYEYSKGFIIRYEYGKPTNIGSEIPINGAYYFLDEVEEPEADETCIGKLCKFWDDKEDKFTYTVTLLNAINKSIEFCYEDYKGTGWKHCRALSKEEAKEYVKE